MKILNFGLDLEPKKYCYEDENFKKIIAKFSPKKKNPYAVEVLEPEQAADVVVVEKRKILDFVLGDLEKIEQRLAVSGDLKEKEVLKEAQSYLEAEKLLSNCCFGAEKIAFLKPLQLASLKPALVKESFEFSPENISRLIGEALKAANRILFFTCSEKEVKAWGLEKGKTVLEAAGKIHSDLQRGFIRADVVNSSYLDDFFNMAEAKNKGLVKTVGKDYIVEPNDIIQIKFNV